MQIYHLNQFHYGIKCNINNLSKNIIYALRRVSHIHTQRLKLPKSFWKDTKKGHNLAVTETLVFTFQYFAHFSAVYNRLREVFELPNVRTLTQVTFQVKTIDGSTYMKQIFTNLNDITREACVLIPIKFMKRQHCSIMVG